MIRMRGIGGVWNGRLLGTCRDRIPAWITSGTTDFLRGDVAVKGRVTGLMKIARLAEGFGMNCEGARFLQRPE